MEASNPKPLFLLLFLFALFTLHGTEGSRVVPGSGSYVGLGDGLIGSVAPTCSYNECKGCKYRCSAEQVPVEGNDPINSAYHYKCICHIHTP